MTWNGTMDFSEFEHTRKHLIQHKDTRQQNPVCNTGLVIFRYFNAEGMVLYYNFNNKSKYQKGSPSDVPRVRVCG